MIMISKFEVYFVVVLAFVIGIVLGRIIRYFKETKTMKKVAYMIVTEAPGKDLGIGLDFNISPNDLLKFHPNEVTMEVTYIDSNMEV